jgi:hypothetical protein
MHVIHIGAICAIGLMTVLAIAATPVPWTRAEAVYAQGTITEDLSLWGTKTTYGETGLSVSKSWVELLGNEENACLGLTNSDLLIMYCVAQAGAILSILGSIAFGVLGLVYGLGKLRKKLLLLIPAGLTFAFAMMAFGGYTTAYNTCSTHLCENFVTGALAKGASSASCGPYAGPFLVWAACALGLAAFCMFMARNAGGAVVRVAVDGVNDTPFQPFAADESP